MVCIPWSTRSHMYKHVHDSLLRYVVLFDIGLHKHVERTQLWPICARNQHTFHILYSSPRLGWAVTRGEVVYHIKSSLFWFEPVSYVTLSGTVNSVVFKSNLHALENFSSFLIRFMKWLIIYLLGRWNIWCTTSPVMKRNIILSNFFELSRFLFLTNTKILDTWYQSILSHLVIFTIFCTFSSHTAYTFIFFYGL